MDFNQK